MVENKRINISFYLVVLFFLAIIFILIKEFNFQRANDFNRFKITINAVARMKDVKIRFLINQLMAQQRENEDLKNTLAETRNDLDIISKKLAQPILPAAPSNPPAPASAPK